MARQRTYAERRLREEGRSFLLGTRWLLLTGALALIAVCVIPAAVGHRTYLLGLLHGFVFTAFVSLAGFAFLLDGEAALLLAGARGEARTHEQLVKAKKRGYIWSGRANVEAGGRDVDHIVLTPAGVLAVESKHRFRSADVAWLGGAAAAAERGARLARLVLMSEDIKQRREVRPLLVVWGGACRKLPDTQVVNGVDVVRGEALIAWLERCSRGPLAEDHAEELQVLIDAFADSCATSR